MLAVACTPADEAVEVIETPEPAPSINDLWEQANLRFNAIPAAPQSPMGLV